MRHDLAACNRPLGAAPSFGFHHSPSAVFLGPTPLRIGSKSSLLSSDENLLTLAVQGLDSVANNVIAIRPQAHSFDPQPDNKLGITPKHSLGAHAARRRGGCVAARGAGAAGGPRAPRRHAVGGYRTRSRSAVEFRSVPANAQSARLAVILAPASVCSDGRLRASSTRFCPRMPLGKLFT
jgi:hypothetical protein